MKEFPKKILIYIILLVLIGAITFMKGYFVTRYISLQFSPEQNPYIKGETEWFEPQTKKIILVIFDAIRFDAIIPDKNTDPQQSYLFKNTLTYFQDKVTNEPQKSRLFKGYGDAPTESIIRINAFLTGTIPTYIEVAFNISPRKVLEDGILTQLDRFDKNIILLGSNLVESAYEGRIYRKYTEDSYTLW